jgi:hypothetical protein
MKRWRCGSLFSGIGGLERGLGSALSAHGGMELAWAVEKDPFCRRVLGLMHPGVPLYDDVAAVGRNELADVDILCGGFPCFPAGTLINTATGLVPIENIQEGDLVRTHALRLRRVVTTMKKSAAPLLEVHAFGAPKFRTTAEHPLAKSGTSLTDATCRSGRPLPATCTHGSACKPSLNPRFVAWLMGFGPDFWDRLSASRGARSSARLATQSSRKWQK